MNQIIGTGTRDGVVQRERLHVADVLCAFIEDEALPGTGIEPSAFWRGLDALVHEMGPATRRLLGVRADLQGKLDDWHRANPGAPDPSHGSAYRTFLQEIGYLQPDPPAFAVATTGVDPEIASIAGPQLVVPVTNARYALNAANARWGSLYDALYGTDVLGDRPAGGAFDPARGARVIDRAKDVLDRVVPLAAGSHRDALGYLVADGVAVAQRTDGTIPFDAAVTTVGWSGDPSTPDRIALRHHGLHAILRLDRTDRVGAADTAGVADVILESALSVIMDCEDSVAVVDAADKVVAYRNWLGLMKGDLSEPVEKGGQRFTRKLADDIVLDGADGPVTLKGRALMLVRNVGHLMTTPAVLDADGAEIGEGLLDAAMTVLIAMHDRARGAAGNAVSGAVYVVKPKLHGPDEVAHAVAIFDRVEAMLGLPPDTVKLGIMDEERRTSVNLAACIHAARHRVAFINTGFLDRTGDEIHSSMEAGVMMRKADMKSAPWIEAYEDRNVDIGLACGLAGRAQIGKGMWAMPDLMADLLEQKIAHPQAGANTAWVPSPTAATLHAIHYHDVDVAARQAALAAEGPRTSMAQLLTIPLADAADWTEADIAAEVENNVQGILGYVVRWVDSGIGCSKVPDIHDVGLMEDRATCRISSQALANWLRHGVVSVGGLEATLRRMAAVVDRQNAGAPGYRPMAPGFDGPAFAAARDLVLLGASQPSGYTEPLLHAWRARAKQGLTA